MNKLLFNIGLILEALNVLGILMFFIYISLINSNITNWHIAIFCYVVFNAAVLFMIRFGSLQK